MSLMLAASACVVGGVVYYHVRRAHRLVGAALFGFVPVLYLTYTLILFPVRLEGVPISTPLSTAVPVFLITALLMAGVHYLAQILTHLIRRLRGPEEVLDSKV